MMMVGEKVASSIAGKVCLKILFSALEEVFDRRCTSLILETILHYCYVLSLAILLLNVEVLKLYFSKHVCLKKFVVVYGQGWVSICYFSCNEKMFQG